MPEQFEIIINTLTNAYPKIKLIYLFGSRAKQEASDKSDWDIAILADKKLTPIERWDLAQNLANELNNDVDLIDLLEASTVLQMQVVQHGMVLFSKDNVDELFAMQVYSMYGRLQESRASIIDDFIDELKYGRCPIK